MAQPYSQARNFTYSWRILDIVTATVIGVFCGLIFWVWNNIGMIWYEAFQALTPGLGGCAVGIWFLGGTLGAAIIRKPGAALYVEILAAVISAAFGNIWGLTTIISGFCQGLGMEIIVALFLYRRCGAIVLMLGAMMSGVIEWGYEFITGNHEKTNAFNVIYLISMSISGAILAGLLAWVLTRMLRRTGVLNSFPSGMVA
ncbi:MAG: ECF transporter S component [Corynebacterium sp.]|nr:ECF transporter S component [Corynebacterium sp.]